MLYNLNSSKFPLFPNSVTFLAKFGDISCLCEQEVVGGVFKQREDSPYKSKKKINGLNLVWGPTQSYPSPGLATIIIYSSVFSVIIAIAMDDNTKYSISLTKILDQSRKLSNQ